MLLISGQGEFETGLLLACVAGGISRASAFVLVAKTCGEAVGGLVKSRVEFPPAQIRGVF